MPITPSALAKRRKAVSFAYGDDTVHLDYYPAAINQESVAALNALQAEAKAAGEREDVDAVDAATLGVGEWLSHVLAWWDYVEDDGETMQPLTAANLAAQMTRFTDFLVAVVSAIMEDRTRGNASGTPSPANSDATSSRTVRSASTDRRESQKRSA